MEQQLLQHCGGQLVDVHGQGRRQGRSTHARAHGLSRQRQRQRRPLGARATRQGQVQRLCA